MISDATISSNFALSPDAIVDVPAAAIGPAEPNSVRNTGSTIANVSAFAAENSRFASVENRMSFQNGRTKGSIFPASSRTV